MVSKTAQQRQPKFHVKHPILLFLSFLFAVTLSGAEALRVFDDAEKLLRKISEEDLFRMEGIIGFYAANSVQDDIYVYKDDVLPRPSGPSAILFGLRQQVKA